MQVLAELLNPQCKDMTFVQARDRVTSISPVFIVVKPWLGRHQVYGLFELPNNNRISYPVLLTVKGAGTYRKEAAMVKVNSDSEYPVQSGHYVLKVHLKTRVALFMMLRGLYLKLKDPMNWTLSFRLVDEADRP